jgi:itaconate CoA-transferase
MYRSEYKKKLMSAEMAVQMINDEDTIIHGMAAGEPPALLGTIADRLRADDLDKIHVYSLLPMDHMHNTLLKPDLVDKVFPYTWFVSGHDRDMVRTGLNQFIPNHFHEVPKLIENYVDLDVVITTVSPMDKAGYFTFGAINDYISIAARHAKKLIVEVNPNMPRVFGDSLLHVSEVDAIVEFEAPLIEFKVAKAKPEAKIIGKYISELIPNGATIQFGIGAIPDAVAGFLSNHKDLGAHTELLSNGMLGLIKSGVINGSRKNLHPRKHVFANALGNKELYDFIHDNPSMESYPVSYVNDPDIIAVNDNMISINSTIEVDLFGQCNSEFLGDQQFSGTGGQLDFVRGAFKSNGGKSFIAFYSTTHDRKVSRIVPKLHSGTVVTTPRMDTNFLVTEYGITDLKGMSLRQRALSIIELAAPQFRDELIIKAEEMKLL